MSQYEVIFHAVEQLILERDPELEISDVKEEALELTVKLMRADSVRCLHSQLPRPKKNELENLQKQAEGLADALENLSFNSKMVLLLKSDPQQVPNFLNRLQLDATDLSGSIKNSLQDAPPVPKKRKYTFALEDLILEAATVFEQALGVSLTDLRNPQSHISKTNKTKFYIFSKKLIPQKLQHSEQATNKAIDRILERRSID